MSTVVYKNGTRIFINPKEKGHLGRPHCHVKKAGAVAVIDLVSFDILSNNGMFSKGDMKDIVSSVQLFHEELMNQWEIYHGKK